MARTRTLIAAWLAMAGVLLLGSGAGVGADAPSWQTPAVLSSAGAGPARIAVDLRGNATVVWGSDRAGAVQAVSRSPGGRWSAPMDLAPTTWAGPDVGVDEAGTVTAIWASGAAPHVVVETATREAGGTFGPARDIAPPTYLVYSPRIAVDQRGGAVAVWLAVDAEQSDYVVRAAFRPPRGAFGAPEVVAVLPRDPQLPRLDVAGNTRGDVLVSWARSFFDAGRWINATEAMFRPAGGRFGAPQALPDAGTPEIALDGSGNAVAVFVSGYDVSDVRAASRPAAMGLWQAAEVIGRGRGASVAVDAEGNATVAWLAADGSVQAATRAPGADHWQAAEALSQPADRAFSPPTVAAGPRGDVVVAWGAADIVRATVKAPGGAFTAPADVSQTGVTLGGIGAVGLDAAGNATVVWRVLRGILPRYSHAGYIEAATYPAAGPGDDEERRLPRPWVPPSTLSTGSAWNTALAADGAAIATWVRSLDANRRVVEAAIRPAGGSWKDPQTLSPPIAGYVSPRLVVDRKGDAFVVWTGASDAGVSQIWLSRRRPGGVFGAARPLGDGAAGTVGMSGNGELVVAWTQQREGSPSVIRVLVSRLGAARSALWDLGAGHDPSIAVNARGAAFLTWMRERTPGEQLIQVAYRPANGRFGAAQTVAIAGYAPSLTAAINGAGLGMVAWSERPGAASAEIHGVRLSRGSFGQPQLIGHSGDGTAQLALAVDDRGDAIAAWTRYDYDRFPVEAAVARAGHAFEPQQPLSADAGGFAFGSAPTGRAVLAWSRFEGDFEAQAAIREPGQLRFGPAVDLSTPGLNTFPAAVALDPEGDAVISWSRSRGGSFLVQTVGFDGAGPRLRALHVPPRGRVGDRLRFSVAPLDVWTKITATRWRFGDGGTASGKRVAHVYRRPGRYRVVVSSTDATGNSTTSQRVLWIRAARR